MSYGQLVAFDYGWIGQTRRPTLDLQAYEAAMALRSVAAVLLRVGAGGGIGAAFGATTSSPMLWLVMGCAIGLLFNHVRERAPRG